MNALCWLVENDIIRRDVTDQIHQMSSRGNYVFTTCTTNGEEEGRLIFTTNSDGPQKTQSSESIGISTLIKHTLILLMTGNFFFSYLIDVRYFLFKPESYLWHDIWRHNEIMVSFVSSLTDVNDYRHSLCGTHSFERYHSLLTVTNSPNVYYLV